ncbi:DUF4406 domain-containing protein, partial [Escherichia coli]
GPMSGKDEQNFYAFYNATADLRRRGWEVTSPHELDENEGLDPTRELTPQEYRHALLRDIGKIAQQDA